MNSVVVYDDVIDILRGSNGPNSTHDTPCSRVSNSLESFQSRYVNFRDRFARRSGKRVVIFARALKNGGSISSSELR